VSERLIVVYDVAGPSPREVVDAVRVEQTIEFPYDLAPAWIQDTVVGRVEDEDGSRITVSYAPEVLGGGLVQLLNVVWGNVSLMEGVRVVGLELPDSVLAALPGPRSGVPGLRDLLGAHDRALLATALKPMGRSAVELAADASTIASAGFDVVKDDHGLADQPWAPWEERVARCADAVAAANAATGGRTLYMSALNVASNELVDRAHRAKELGAGALLVLPGLVGFDALRALAADDSLALPS
jgi:ribulose-bisphosphate carboxylase large chain